VSPPATKKWRPESISKLRKPALASLPKWAKNLPQTKRFHGLMKRSHYPYTFRSAIPLAKRSVFGCVEDPPQDGI
jgi:hypothetical protein